MSEPLIQPGQPEGVGDNDTVSIRESFDVVDNTPTSALGYQKSKTGRGGSLRPDPRLHQDMISMIIMWTLCVVLLILFAVTIFVWSRPYQGDYGIGVLRKSTNCGVPGTIFMTFITLCFNGVALFVVYASGYIRVKTTPHWSLRILLILFSIPVPLL
jgi:hypothetical protein